jgi:hypothetical protein
MMFDLGFLNFNLSRFSRFSFFFTIYKNTNENLIRSLVSNICIKENYIFSNYYYWSENANLF